MRFDDVSDLKRLFKPSHPLQPMCRRCGHGVDHVDMQYVLDRSVVVISYLCHGALFQHSVCVDGLVRFRPDRDWADTFPTHVFEYEPFSFVEGVGWDANGSPVEAV